MVLIRADANEQIGTGHVMRCLSIAKAFLTQGEEVLFSTADHHSDELISQNGFSSICLDTAWSDMEAELVLLKEYVLQYQPKILLVDGYYTTEKYFYELSKIVKTAYIDDLNKACWDVDSLINYNIYASECNYSGYKGKRTKLLLGPQFAPLREEFRNLPRHVIRDRVTDIFVSAGGADPEKITEKLITEICPLCKDIRFHFAVGALNSRIEKIKDLASAQQNVILHVNETHMANLMMNCDLAISAAGSTLYELCACGTPTITYTLAENQMIAAKNFENRGIMINAGDCRGNSDFIKYVKEGIVFFKKEKGKRISASEKMKRVVHGDGAKRIVYELGSQL